MTFFVWILVVAALIGIVLFPELGLVLCLVAGPLLKGVIQPFFGAIDITALLYAMTGSVILIRMLVRKEKLVVPPPLFNYLVIVFLGFLVVGYFRSPLPKYAIQILLRFTFLDLGLLYLVVAGQQLCPE